MSIFKNIFIATPNNIVKEESNIHWIPLISLEQLEELKETSKKETVFIFKYSTRCFTSKIVFKQFEKSFSEEMKKGKGYFLDVINYRETSDAVGYTFQVIHESPQLLVIKNGVVVKHASHHDITNVDLRSYGI